MKKNAYYWKKSLLYSQNPVEAFSQWELVAKTIPIAKRNRWFVGSPNEGVNIVSSVYIIKTNIQKSRMPGSLVGLQYIVKAYAMLRFVMYVSFLWGICVQPSHADLPWDLVYLRCMWALCIRCACERCDRFTELSSISIKSVYFCVRFGNPKVGYRNEFDI